MPSGSDGQSGEKALRQHMFGGPAAAEDDDERIDPAAGIWAKQRKKEMEASMRRFEARNDEIDQVRKQVKLEDTKRAKDTWSEAEAALKQALGSKHRAGKDAKEAEDPLRDNGLRKHGEAVKGRKERPSPTEQLGSPPLQRTSVLCGSDSETAEAASSSRGLGSPSWSRTVARDTCFEKRSKLRREKAVAAAENKHMLAKKRLRNKVASVLIEVRKRQELHEVQAKAKKFREQRHAAGRGPSASLGDTSEFALGLAGLADGGGEQATSPRRTALLDSLSLEELSMLRDHPSFFFVGNQIAAAMSPEQSKLNQELTNGRSRLLGALASSSSSFMSGSAEPAKAPKGLWQGSVDGSVFEDLIEFFSVSSQDKAMDISLYARNLRSQLLAGGGRRGAHLGGGTDVDWRKRLCRSEAEDCPQEEQLLAEESLPKGPLEMMPCLGRHPHVRDDAESPTLMKVREVYQKREEQDARWLDERREAISRRIALNAFKAREQQRELQLQDFKQKELHKVRMLQAEEKKAMMEAENAERTEVTGIQKIHRLMVANERSERLKEEKRDNAQMALESWQDGVERAQRYARKMEWDKRKDGERSQEKYLKRLAALGESRQNIARTQAQKNDELKTRIQVSLCSQVQDAQEEQSAARAEAYNAKLEAARVRRRQAQLGSRYSFVEKAFGSSAISFDAKHHSGAIDRRCESWQRSAEAWNRTKGSFSAPILPPARPLSPGGTMDEKAFKALNDFIDSEGFKSDALAVAVA